MVQKLQKGYTAHIGLPREYSGMTPLFIFYFDNPVFHKHNLHCSKTVCVTNEWIFPTQITFSYSLGKVDHACKLLFVCLFVCSLVCSVGSFGGCLNGCLDMAPNPVLILKRLNITTLKVTLKREILTNTKTTLWRNTK